MKVPTLPCDKCDGTGQLPDDRKLGRQMRVARQRGPQSLRDVATYLGFSASYVCDLELGRRRWHPELVKNYLNAIGWKETE